MHASEQPIAVAILAFPEVTASTVFGMYDLFMSVGRDWEMAVNGREGRSLMKSMVVSRTAEPFVAGNNVRISPDGCLGDCPAPDIVCVPEVFVAPGDELEGRFRTEIEWLLSCYASGATIATACSGALLLAESGLLDGHDATTHWAFCDALSRRYPKVRVQAQRALVVSGEGQRLVMAGGGT